jgi:hypothetical protein
MLSGSIGIRRKKRGEKNKKEIVKYLADPPAPPFCSPIINDSNIISSLQRRKQLLSSYPSLDMHKKGEKCRLLANLQHSDKMKKYIQAGGEEEPENYRDEQK